jgi:PKD repeat protein
MPYLETELSMKKPYIQSVTTHVDELELNIKTAIANGGAAPVIDWGDTNTDTGTNVTHTYTNAGIYAVKVTSGTDVKEYTFFMRDVSYAPIPLSIVAPTFASPANTKSTSTALTVNGTPFIKVFVDWGDNTGNIPQGFDAYLPVTQSPTDSTFNLAHTYQSAGSYVVRIFAEHLIEGAMAQERQQISLVKSVAVT